MSIRIASKNDSAALQQLLGTVFDDDPLTEWFIRNDYHRIAAYKSFFDYMVNKYCLPYGECWVTDDVTGAALWMPPGKWELPFLKQIAATRQIIGIFGIFNLLKKLNDRRIIDRNHPKHPHYFLAALAVQSSEREKGLGSILLRPVLDRSDFEGVGCYLETSRKRNINFYERHGFSIMKKVHFSPEKKPLWCMWRSPQTKRRAPQTIRSQIQSSP